MNTSLVSNENANMAKPTLVYYDILQYVRPNQDLLNQYFEVVTLPDPSFDTPEILSRASVILAPLGYFLGKEKMDQASQLKVIGSNTTGHPHIDVDYAKHKNVRVITLKDYSDFLDTITPTAELTWGLVIALTRNVFPASRSVLNGEWSRWPFGGRAMLSRMTLGVAGLGRLGRRVASYGRAFGMTVEFYDPYVSAHPSEYTRRDSLEELVDAVDVVTVHIPHEPGTEKLFDSMVFSRFKKGSYFINTSRGELVEDQALLEALTSGRLAGAAVDVLNGEFEPGFQAHVLSQPLVAYASTHDNLVITPHIGGSTLDAWSLTQEFTILQVIAALADHGE
jgi:D-3-phosphoglycerate dehydrogenase